MIKKNGTSCCDEGCGLPNANHFSPHTEKSSSLPGSSRELAEIFGTSDDEEDMDFPFSLNVDKTFPDLHLADSEFFLKSIKSLGMDSALVSSSDTVGEKLVVAGSGMVAKRVNVIPETKGVNVSSTGVEGVNTVSTVSAGVDGGEGKVDGEGVKSADMDTTCAEDNKDEGTLVASGKSELRKQHN